MHSIFLVPQRKQRRRKKTTRSEEPIGYLSIIRVNVMSHPDPEEYIRLIYMHCISSSIMKGLTLPSDSFLESVLHHFLNLLGLRENSLFHG